MDVIRGCEHYTYHPLSPRTHRIPALCVARAVAVCVGAAKGRVTQLAPIDSVVL